ncbi:MAG TPA: hypothetical protein VFV83_01280 [Chthoniobacteraceae bacterium]|nr:hypothetical protein [Chthoniobacteraceae bacterium]
MNPRLRIFLLVLAVLVVGNIGWRLWRTHGLITIDVTDRSLAEVIRSVEKQSGIKLRSNAPADTKVTLHLRKVPLLHALEVLAATTDTNLAVAYFAAPDKRTIAAALAAITAGQQAEGWKRFALPPMRGMADFDDGTTDPREEQWKVKAADEPTLHAYLAQGAHTLSAQFLAPEQWNPHVAKAPKSGKVSSVISRLAKSVRGESAEVFLLRGRPQRSGEVAGANAASNREPRDGAQNGRDRGLRPDDMRKAMEERELAQIERLPKEKQAEARARWEERKKFFADLAQLSEEERRAKIEEAIEKMMNDSERAAKMMAEGVKRSAMKTASQRAARYRGYLDRKRAQ